MKILDFSIDFLISFIDFSTSWIFLRMIINMNEHTKEILLTTSNIKLLLDDLLKIGFKMSQLTTTIYDTSRLKEAFFPIVSFLLKGKERKSTLIDLFIYSRYSIKSNIS